MLSSVGVAEAEEKLRLLSDVLILLQLKGQR